MAAAKKQPNLVEHFLPHLVADDLRLPKPAMLYIRDVVSILTKPPPPPSSSSRPSSSSSFLSFLTFSFPSNDTTKGEWNKRSSRQQQQQHNLMSWKEKSIVNALHLMILPIYDPTYPHTHTHTWYSTKNNKQNEPTRSLGSDSVDCGSNVKKKKKYIYTIFLFSSSVFNERHP